MVRAWLVVAVLISATVAAGDTAVPAPVPEGVPCRTIADCWLDEGGKPIKRPRKFRGRAIPRGDCGNKLNWLSNRLACVDNRCVATHIGDRC